MEFILKGIVKITDPSFYPKGEGVWYETTRDALYFGYLDNFGNQCYCFVEGFVKKYEAVEVKKQVKETEKGFITGDVLLKAIALAQDPSLAEKLLKK